MNLYLMRHFEVDYKWRKKYTSEEFKIACKEYDESNIKVSDFNCKYDLNNSIIYISTLKRSKSTLDALNIENEFRKTSLINEILIGPFINTKLRLPLILWMILGRLQWFLNVKTQPETKFDTTQKIKKLIDLINIEEKDILIIGHGFYFSYLKKFLKKEFSVQNKSMYKNGEIIRLQKTPVTNNI